MFCSTVNPWYYKAVSESRNALVFVVDGGVSDHVLLVDAGIIARLTLVGFGSLVVEHVLLQHTAEPQGLEPQNSSPPLRYRDCPTRSHPVSTHCCCEDACDNEALIPALVPHDALKFPICGEPESSRMMNVLYSLSSCVYYNLLKLFCLF